MSCRIVPVLSSVLLLAACKGEDPAKVDNTVEETTDTNGTTDTNEPPDEDPVPASIEISFDTYVGDVDQTFIATIVVRDAEGNEIPDADTDLVVDIPDSGEIRGNEVTLHAEGIFVVTATLADGTLATNAAPIRIDDNGPVLTLTSPANGAWLDGDTATVEGMVTDQWAGVQSVRVNGEEATVNADGSFSHSVVLLPGASAIEVVATDNDSNVSDAWLGVMSGAYADPTAKLNGMQVGLSADGIFAVAAPLMGQLEASAVEAVLKASNPVDRGSVSCATYSINVVSLDYGTPALQLTPQDGSIHMEVQLTDLELKANVTVNACGLYTTTERITITDTLTTITGDIEAIYLVLFGGVTTGISDTAVSYANFDIDYGSLQTVLDSLGLNPADLGFDAEAIISEVIIAAVEEEVPPPIADALNGLDIEETLDILGVPVTLATETHKVTITEDGLAVQMYTQSTGPAANPELPPLPGALSLGGDPPTVNPAADVSLSLQIDELNRVLHLAHTSGAFLINISDRELGLDPTLIDFVFPGASTLNLRFSPTIPPVLLPKEGTPDLALRMLALELVGNGDVDGVDTELVHAWVHVLGTVQTTINADGNVALEVTEITPVVDILPPPADQVAAKEQLEEALASISVSVIGELFPSIVFAIPEVQGMTIEATGAATAGDTQTWLEVQADLTE